MPFDDSQISQLRKSLAGMVDRDLMNPAWEALKVFHRRHNDHQSARLFKLCTSGGGLVTAA